MNFDQIDIGRIKTLSYAGLILWFLVVLAYIWGIYCKYSSKKIKSAEAASLKKFIDQTKFIIKLAQFLIIIASVSILVNSLYYNFKRSIEIMFLLLGVILPAYFLGLYGFRIEEIRLDKRKIDQEKKE